MTAKLIQGLLGLAKKSLLRKDRMWRKGYGLVRYISIDRETKEVGKRKRKREREGDRKRAERGDIRGSKTAKQRRNRKREKNTICIISNLASDSFL